MFWVHGAREELQEKAMAELTQLSQRAEARPPLKVSRVPVRECVKGGRYSGPHIESLKSV